MLRHWEYEDEQDRLEFSQYEDPDPHAGSEWAGGQEGNPKYYDPEFIKNAQPKIDPFDEWEKDYELNKLIASLLLDRKIGDQK